jgi:hypothetical protein
MIQYLIFGGKMPFNLQKLKLKIVISALFFTFSTVAYAETTDNADSTAKADRSVEAQFHTEESQTENEYSAESGHHGAHGVDGAALPLWSIIPFVGILLSIALFPLIAPHFWHHHFPKISAAWAVLFAVPFVVVYGGRAWHDILHIYLLDYIPFIILLWGLFTVSGGILIKGSLKGTPQVNFMIILIGTMIASWIGTTGAAMVMIRPLLRANENRKYKVHLVVFFIFLVANIGGLLTPLGDPPLFFRISARR